MLWHVLFFTSSIVYYTNIRIFGMRVIREVYLYSTLLPVQSSTLRGSMSYYRTLGNEGLTGARRIWRVFFFSVADVRVFDRTSHQRVSTLQQSAEQLGDGFV